MAAHPTQIAIASFDELKQQAGKSQIIDAAISTLEQQHATAMAKEGGGFTLNFHMNFALFA